MSYQHDALIDMPNLSNSDLSSAPTRQHNINNNPTHDSHSVNSHGRRNRERRQSRMILGMNLPPLRERDHTSHGGRSNDEWGDSVHSNGVHSNGVHSNGSRADPGDILYHSSQNVAEKRPSLRSMTEPPPPLQEIDVDEKTAEGEQSYSTNSEFDSIKSRFFNRVNNVAASAARRTTAMAGGGRFDGPNNDRRYQELMAEHNKAIERYIEFEDQNKRLVGELMEVKFEMANMMAKQDQYEMTIRQLKDENDALKVKIDSMEEQLLQNRKNEIEVVPDDDESLLTLDMSLYNRAQSKGKLRSHKTLSQTEDDDSDQSNQPVNPTPRPNSPQHSIQSISLASQSAASQSQTQSHTSSRSLRRKNKVRVVRRTNSNASISSRSQTSIGDGSRSASHRSKASRTRLNESIVRSDSVTRIEEEPAIPTTIEGQSLSSRSIDEQTTRTRRPRAIPADRLFKIVGGIRNKPGAQPQMPPDDHPRRTTNIGTQIGDKFEESRRNFGFQRRFGRWQ